MINRANKWFLVALATISMLSVGAFALFAHQPPLDEYMRTQIAVDILLELSQTVLDTEEGQLMYTLKQAQSRHNFIAGVVLVTYDGHFYNSMPIPPNYPLVWEPPSWWAEIANAKGEVITSTWYALMYTGCRFGTTIRRYIPDFGGMGAIIIVKIYLD
ncbi:MAG: hypothetical protein FWD97_10045 [Defluviitaleaceae bacterium]|nr:hypothetical protein [Defluviitaleaceae bacterium]